MCQRADATSSSATRASCRRWIGPRRSTAPLRVRQTAHAAGSAMPLAIGPLHGPPNERHRGNTGKTPGVRRYQAG
jgi:hypothetical protein